MMAEKISDPNLDSMCLSPSRRRESVTECTLKNNEEIDVRTTYGPMRVIVNGDPRLPAMFTYHDIGLNSVSCFESFFNYADVQTIMKQFCVYHVNALGQQQDAETLPKGLGPDHDSSTKYVYPTMDQLASTLLQILEHFKLRSFVGFGVGAGANILCRFALVHPEKVDGLILINGNASKAGWVEWGYQKLNSWYLKGGQMTSGSEDYLMWHWFGKKTTPKNRELIKVFMDYVKGLNPTNLGHFVSSYVQRTDLGIAREIDPSKKFGVKNFKCNVMLVAGTYSAHLDDTVEMNARLDPVNSNWMKFDCGGMVLQEAPNELAEAMRCFLQGLGFVPAMRRLSQINAPELAVPTLSSLRRTSQVTAPNLDQIRETEGAPLRRLSQVTLPHLPGQRRHSNIQQPRQLAT